MDSSKTDAQITIVNRSKEYRIRKNLIWQIPYFGKMLCHGSAKVKENKFELDFDEQAVKSILDWVKRNYSIILIEMDYVFDLCELADYLGLDVISKECSRYFKDNFSIEHLPVIIPKVTKTSECINSNALNTFICRYFLKIANTTFWTGYPIETIKYICALDLMVYSEYQVFDAIMRWVNFKVDTRKSQLKGLFKLVRSCYLNEQDLSKIEENELFKYSNFKSKTCSGDESACNCSIDRTKQNYFISIEKLEDSDLLVKIFDQNFGLFIHQELHLDKALPLNLPHGEHISDILFDSGRKMIRIDWDEKNYRLLNFKNFKSHFLKMNKLILDKQKSEEHYAVITKSNDPLISDHAYESSLLEADDKFILVRNYENQFKYWATPTVANIQSHFIFKGHTYLATILANYIYILTNELEFIQFDFERKCKLERIGLEKFKDKLNFSSLLLTSSKANEVIIVNKNTNALFCYNVKTKKWSSMGRIVDREIESRHLIAFTSAFISMAPIERFKRCLSECTAF